MLHTTTTQEEDTEPYTHTHKMKTSRHKMKSSRDLEVGIDKYLQQQFCNRNNNYEASTKKDNLTMATILKNPPQQKQRGCVTLWPCHLHEKVS